MASADWQTLDRHPKLFELLESGCKDNDIAAMATQIYLELTKVREWQQVELCFSHELNVAYVTGHRPDVEDSSSFKVVVPVRVQRELTIGDLKTFQGICPQSNGSVILGFIDQDSTIVYYELEEGIRNLKRTTSRESVTVEPIASESSGCVGSKWNEANFHNLKTSKS